MSDRLNTIAIFESQEKMYECALKLMRDEERPLLFKYQEGPGACPVIADLHKYAEFVANGDERVGLIKTDTARTLSGIPVLFVDWGEMWERGFLPPDAWFTEKGLVVMDNTRPIKWKSKVDRWIESQPETHYVYSLWVSENK